MKSNAILITILLLLAVAPAYAQPTAQPKNKLLFFDNGQKRFDGNYHFAFRQSVPASGQEVDPLFGTGTLQPSTEEIYDRARPVMIYEGKCTFYYEDGKKRAEANFTDGLRHGKFLFWHPNGKLATEKNYDRGLAAGPWQYWYDNGQQRASVTYIKLTDQYRDSLYYTILFPPKENRDRELEEYKLYYNKSYAQLEATDDGQLYLRGKLAREQLARIFSFAKNLMPDYAVPDGPATFYYASGKKKAEIKYSKGQPAGTWTWYGETDSTQTLKFDKGLITSINGQTVSEYVTALEQKRNASMQEKIFTSVEQMPEYPGGQEALRKFLNDNIGPLKDTAMGKATVKMVVGLDGKLSDIKILRSISKESDAE